MLGDNRVDPYRLKFLTAYRSLRLELRNANRCVETYRRCAGDYSFSTELMVFEGVGNNTERTFGQRAFTAALYAVSKNGSFTRDPIIRVAHRKLDQRQHQRRIAETLLKNKEILAASGVLQMMSV